MARFNDKALNGLQACARSVSAPVVPATAKACWQERGNVRLNEGGTDVKGDFAAQVAAVVDSPQLEE